MIFRLTAPNWERQSPDYGSHIIMSISGIYLFFVNPHIISFTSPILNSGARDNIFPSHTMSRQNIRLLSSAAWHRLTIFRRPLPILHIMDSGRRINCTQRPRSRISPACSTSSASGSVRRINAHVQQPSLLNIDLHSTVR